MAPPRWLAAEIAEAKKVGPYTGTDLLEYKPGKHCPVTLPSRGPEGGWKAATEEEWDKVFRFDRKTGKCGLTSPQWNALKELHMRAYYASGNLSGDCRNVKDTIAMFVRNGLACLPWRQGRHFWGLKNSVKKARARLMKAGQDAAQQRHDNWIEHLIELMGEVPDADLSHDKSYVLEKAKAALREVAGRGIELPSTSKELRKLLGKIVGPSGVCPDCLVETLLVILEHAKDGPHAGRVRSRDCIVCNQSGRSFTDLLIAVAHALAETLTAEDHARVAELAIAHARPGQATREAKKRLAKAQRLAAAATVEADEKALAHVSTTRLHAAGAAGDDTYQARRAAAIEAEQARAAAERQRREAREARNAALPPIRKGARVVVIDEASRYCGRRGVVQGRRGDVHIGVLLAGDASDRCFYRRQLRIDASRKPAARKPSARKPAAKKPSKKKARK